MKDSHTRINQIPMNTRLLILKSFLILIMGWGSTFSVFAIGDSIRAETRIDQVYQQYNVTGQGVIYAIFDRGIDYTHPDFIDANGKTRIAYIFDMVDNTGQNDPDNTYGVGTIYDEAEINQALSSGNPLPTNDLYGHGIATAGIGAGNGTAVPGNSLYRGVAYEAKLIVVKGFQDGFPPLNGNPGQTGFFDPTYIPIALDFISDKVAELAMPSVTLMNLGSIGGPTDGTSTICQAMDAFVGPGKLLVCGSGDDGGGDNRASGTIMANETISLDINKGVAGNLRLEIWYPGDDRFDIALETPAGNFGPYSSPATNALTDFKNPTSTFYYHRGADFDFSGASSNTRQVLIDFQGAPGTYKVKITGATVVNGNWTASLNPANLFSDNDFLTFVQGNGSINDYASAFEVITPTDYVWDNTWIDVNGVPRSRTGEGAVGDIWVGSSTGPTVDGRLGIDIAVPGEVIFTSYSPGTYYSQFEFNQIQGGNGFYGLQNAVSACAPILSGLLALMLEMKPDLTVAEAKNILHQTARADAFTGTVPNETWGHGKLDALAAMQQLETLIPIEKELRSDDLQLFPNPARDQVRVEWRGQQARDLALTLLDMNGRVLLRRKLDHHITEVELKELSAGVYVLRLENEEAVATRRIVKL
jgi:minor extracellular serine protease Vpr